MPDDIAEIHFKSSKSKSNTTDLFIFASTEEQVIPQTFSRFVLVRSLLYLLYAPPLLHCSYLLEKGLK